MGFTHRASSCTAIHRNLVVVKLAALQHLAQQQNFLTTSRTFWQGPPLRLQGKSPGIHPHQAKLSVAAPEYLWLRCCTFLLEHGMLTVQLGWGGPAVSGHDLGTQRTNSKSLIPPIRTTLRYFSELQHSQAGLASGVGKLQGSAGSYLGFRRLSP